MGLTGIRRRETKRGTDEPLLTYIGKGVPANRVAPGEKVMVSVTKAAQLLSDFPDEWDMVNQSREAVNELAKAPKREDVVEELMRVPGVGRRTANKLYDVAVYSPDGVYLLGPDKLAEVVGKLTADRILGKKTSEE